MQVIFRSVLPGGRTVHDCDLHGVIFVNISVCSRIFCQSGQANTRIVTPTNPMEQKFELRS
jgi:hypothetical protein